MLLEQRLILVGDLVFYKRTILSRFKARFCLSLTPQYGKNAVLGSIDNWKCRCHAFSCFSVDQQLPRPLHHGIETSSTRECRTSNMH